MARKFSQIQAASPTGLGYTGSAGSQGVQISNVAPANTSLIWFDSSSPPVAGYTGSAGSVGYTGSAGSGGTVTGEISSISPFLLMGA